ncbi:MAG: hypothetical protein WEA11_01725 [Acidimicrobiales bacterium]
MASKIEAARWRSTNHAHVTLIVPAAAQVEAGWDRKSSRASGINRYPIAISSLDAEAANFAARIATKHSLKPADAQIGVVCQTQTARDVRVIVLTSNPDAITRAASPTPVAAIRI